MQKSCALLDFDDPDKDKKRLEKDIKALNKVSHEGVSVNFPFLDIHPKQSEIFRTNARMSQTFDQIGLFSRDEWLPTYLDNAKMGKKPIGPDYGVFNFTELFTRALGVPESQREELIKRFEHKVSDHMPLWMRLPLP